jgi:hypothetical protein
VSTREGKFFEKFESKDLIADEGTLLLMMKEQAWLLMRRCEQIGCLD